MALQKLFVAVAAASTFGLAGSVFAATTSLTYTSSPESWVGHGETVAIDPTQGFGFDFRVTRNFRQGISFAIDDYATSPDIRSVQWWTLDFVAPHDAPLQAGSYGYATRFGFNPPSIAGLDFSGNNRGDNELVGSFNVLEVSYAPDGSVLSFDATFKQYDEGVGAWWNIGEIRYNSSFVAPPVPEADSAALFGAGLALLGIAAARSRKPR